MCNKNICSVNIVFENCENITLYPNMFTELICENIIKNYWINCFQYRNGEIHEFITCDYFSIIINKLGLKQKTGCGDILKNRLDNHKDITHINLRFKKGNEYISVPWLGINYTNELQKHKICEDGLIIEIKKLEK